MVDLNISSFVIKSLLNSTKYNGQLTSQYYINQERIYIPKIHLKNNNQSITLSNVKYNIQKNNYDGKLKILNFPINTKYIDNKSFSLSTYFKGDKYKVKLKNMLVKFGNSNISGNTNIKFYPNIHIKTQMEIDFFNLSDFLDLHGAKFDLYKTELIGDIIFHDKKPYGRFNINSSTGKILGLNLNKVATDFQKFLDSIYNGGNISGSFKKIKNEVVGLGTSFKGHIDPLNGQKTEFKHISLAINFDNTKIILKEILVDANDFYITGQGMSDLQQRALNYNLKAHMYKYGDTKLEEYKKLFIPYRVYGKFNSIKYSVDINPILHKLLEHFLEEKSQDIFKRFLK